MKRILSYILYLTLEAALYLDRQRKGRAAFGDGTGFDVGGSSYDGGACDGGVGGSDCT